MSDVQPRKPAGTPTGGEFANKSGSAPASTLTPQEADPTAAFLKRVGGGDAPTSRFGRRAQHWGPFAHAYSLVLIDGGLDRDAAEQAAATAVVNDNDEVWPAIRDSEHCADDWTDDRCYQCGADLNDGEGWDGRCGNCADQAETARIERQWGQLGIADADREQWEHCGFDDPFDAYERSKLPYTPAEWLRLETGGLTIDDVAAFTTGAVTRPEAMIAWKQAGYNGHDACNEIAYGSPGPASDFNRAAPPTPAMYDTLRELQADSLSEAGHQRGDRYPEVSAAGGTAATRARRWDGAATTVEATYNPNLLTAFEVVGLSGDQVRAVRDRVRAGILNSGLAWPGGRVTVSVAGGELDSRCDAAIAASVLAATGQIHPLPDHTEMWGELTLDGRIVDTDMRRS